MTAAGAMRRVRQPGPGSGHALQAVPAAGRRLRLTLAPGRLLLDSLREAFAAEGFASGVVRLPAGMTLSPFAYVMPALSATPDHAAFYSETFAPPGESVIETGALTFGARDGAPFFHGHALWREADGRRTGGHILPDRTVLAQAVTVEAVGLSGAGFVARQDPETNFKLFVPEARPQDGPPQDGPFHVLRLLPNHDACTALEEFCAARGIARAMLHGGVGSTIGARFADGGTIEPFATEIAITAGTVAPGRDGALQADIAIALVDYTGGLAEGRLRRGDNPVLMTFELVLEAL